MTQQQDRARPAASERLSFAAELYAIARATEDPIVLRHVENRIGGWGISQTELEDELWRRAAEIIREHHTPEPRLRFYCHAGLKGCFCAYRTHDHVSRADRHQRFADIPGWWAA